MTFKEARKRAKLTRQQVYEIMGIPISTQKKWELGISEAPGWAEDLVVEKLMRIKEELENLGYLKKKKKINSIRKNKKPAFETYYTKDGIEICIGKNNLQNDYLTFKHAHRYDTWFHVKDMPGSHVIVKGDQLDEYTIRLASNIAAYFSKGKNSSSVPVNYTLVKTLKKPNAAKPGQVILDKYKTIYIDPDASCLEELRKK